MKKIKYIFFFVISFVSLFINIENINAAVDHSFNFISQDISYDEKKFDCEDCLLLCGYENVNDGVNTGVYVVYLYSTDEFLIGWSTNKSSEYTFYRKVVFGISTWPSFKAGYGNMLKIYYEGNASDNSTTGSLYNTLSRGVCPSYGYSRLPKGLIDNISNACFANSTTYCNTLDENFAGASFLKYSYLPKINEKFRALIAQDCNTLINDKDAKGLKDVFFLNINGTDDKNLPTIFLDGYKEKRKKYVDKIKACEVELGNTSEIRSKANNIIEAANNINLGKDSFIIDEEVTDCDEMLGKNLVKFINLIYLIFKIISVVLLILFLFLDFTGAVASSDKDALKSASQKAMKRTIAVIMIFLLPLLIRVIGKIVGLDFTCIMTL